MKRVRINPEGVTDRGLAYVVIDSSGNPSCDVGAEPQSYASPERAIERARLLAETMPGEPVYIYEKMAKVMIPLGEMKVEIFSEGVEK